MSVTAYGQESGCRQGLQFGVTGVPQIKTEVWHPVGHFRATPIDGHRQTSPLVRFGPLGNIKPSILRLGFLFSLTDLRQRPRIKLEVLSMSLGAGLAVSIRTAAGAALALLVLTAPVIACRGALYHKILLDAVPPAAEGSEVIAKVEIVEVQIRELPGLRPFHVARARVLQSIRGTADGQIVQIDAEGTTCGGRLDQSAVGRRGFIAGHFHPIADETLFIGIWRF